MPNIIVIGLNDRNKKKPLRGDCQGANLDYVPGDASFKVNFFTEDTKAYTLYSVNKFFINGNVANQITFGGRSDLSIELMYDLSRSTWVVTNHNLNGGSGGGAGQDGADGVNGTNGITPTINAMAETLPAGSPATVTVSGPITNRTFVFGIPQGARGLPGTGGTGTGGTFMPEVELVQDVDGAITMDGTVSNAFRVLLNKPLIVRNPVNYQPGQEIRLVIRQPLVGGPFEVFEWGLLFGHPDRQPPKLATKPGGVNSVRMTYSDAMGPDHAAVWNTEVEPRLSAIGYGAASFIARNLMTGVSSYVLRSPAGIGALTEVRPNQTIKILRDGLGIEAYGAIDGGLAGQAGGGYLITGALGNGNRAELRTGPGVRPAYDRGVLVFGGNVTATIQDLILSGAREQGGGAHIAQGFSVSGPANLTVKNVRITDNENGTLTGGDYTGNLNMIDCEFDANAKGDFGYTHNIYTGDHLQPWTALRTSFINAPGGHNIKSRSGDCILNQVRTYDAKDGREVDLPNGGQIHATDCRFEHLDTGAQNDCVRIGAEGVITTRPRAYIFRNCHFINGIQSARKASFIWNQDADTDVQCIDCTFEGPKGWPDSDANGNVGRVVVSFTGGPVGPRLPVGYFPIAVTPVAG